MKKTHLTEIKFADLNLAPQVVTGLEAMGFEYCTSIQAKSLPVLLQGTDIAGQAQTGEGKTIAFLAATFHQLLQQEAPKHNQPRALIMAPTRELAIQIHRDAIEMSKSTGLRLGIVYGGEGYESQRLELEQGVDIGKLGGKEARIDYGSTGFGGACPPKGHGMHRYQFTVWALPKATLGLDENTTPAVVGFTLNSIAIDKATLTATYTR